MSEKRQTFSRTHRLSGKEAFAAVYDARQRHTRGPLTIYGKRNDLPHSRMGISMSRRVGTAPVRNRINRLLRECFRLMQHDLPAGFDWIIVVRPHAPLGLAEYQEIVRGLMTRLAAM